MTYDLAINRDGRFMISYPDSDTVRLFSLKDKEHKGPILTNVERDTEIGVLDDSGKYWVTTVDKLLLTGNIDSVRSLSTIFKKMSGSIVMAINANKTYEDMPNIMVLLLASNNAIKKMSFSRFSREDLLRAFREKKDYEKTAFNLPDGNKILQAFIFREEPISPSLLSIVSDLGYIMTFNTRRLDEHGFHYFGDKIYNLPKGPQRFYLINVNTDANDEFVCYLSKKGSLLINSTIRTKDNSIEGNNLAVERAFKPITGFNKFKGDEIFTIFPAKTEDEIGVKMCRFNNNKFIKLNPNIDSSFYKLKDMPSVTNTVDRVFIRKRK